MKLPKFIQEIAKDIEKAGGKAYIVGGYVRDFLFNKHHKMHLSSKDIDIEVYGLQLEALSELLKPHGSLSEVGKSFGVLKLCIGDEDYDFSLPRTETKTGENHNEFDVSADPYLPIEKAVLRRDFTMNALMFDITKGEIIDLVNGEQDIKDLVLRHTSDKFSEDPLRVLRGMQFCGRFNLKAHPSTMVLCKSLIDKYPHLTRERVILEWEKLLLKGKYLIKGLYFLSEIEWFNLFFTKRLVLFVFSKEIIASWSVLKLIDKQYDFYKRFLFLYEIFNPTKEFKALFEKESGYKRLINTHEAYKYAHNSSSRNETVVNWGIALKKYKVDYRFIKDVLIAWNVIWSDSNTSNTFLDTPKELFKPVITGKDLISKGVKPSKEMGDLLEEIFKIQLYHQETNKEEILKIAKEEGLKI